MKKLLALLMSICLLFSAFAGAGCKGEAGSNNPETLEIYCYIAGFGSVWLEGTIDLFKQQDWVKEKYPDLKIVLETDSQSSQATNRLYNQKTSYTDLFFGAYSIDKIDPSYLVNLTENVYLTEIPGQPEDGLIWDRVHPLAHAALVEEGYGKTTYEGEEYDNYYGMKYVAMYYGWMYNKDLFEANADRFGWQLPVTTEELFNICDDIKKSGYTYETEDTTETSYTPIMYTATKGGYASSQFPVYWCQYEGYDQYENYYNGQDALGRISDTIFEQKGRLRALQVIEETFSNYAYEHANTVEFIPGQGRFLVGDGMFHWNGDYFTTEMANTRNSMRKRLAANGKTDYTIESFATPVLSSLVERLSFYIENELGDDLPQEMPYSSFENQAKPYDTLTQEEKDKYDAVLAAMIRDIDAGATWDVGATEKKSYAGYEVTKEDWDIVAEARTFKGSRALSNQAAVVPQSTPAKELACDFLRFFYTDVAIENYGKTSKGLTFPVNYYENLSDAEYEEATAGFEPEAKTKYDMFFKDDILCAYIPDNEQFSFGKIGLDRLNGYTANMNQDFIKKPIDTTAEVIFQRVINYWDGSNWDNLIRQAEAKGYA